MDKYLNEEELQLQALIMAKDFEDLNENEKAFVLKKTSQSDYCLERAIVVYGAAALEDQVGEQPRPLVLPMAGPTTVFTVKMPVYQTLILVAATVVLMWLMIPRTYQLGHPIVQDKIVYHTDTITQEVLKHDTVVKLIEQPIYIDRPVYITETSATLPVKEAPRLLEVSPNIELPELSASSIANPGHSIKDDGTASLITEF